MIDSETIKGLIEIIKQSGGTAPYDTTAEVIRSEDGVAWVHIPGGVDETPVAMSVNAKKGDTVRVRVAGGQAWIVGNDTAPPTDDKKAEEAKERANNAVKKVENFDKGLDQEEVLRRLTKNFTEEAIYRSEDGHLYINLTYVRTGILQAGLIRSIDGLSSWNLDTGELNLKGYVCEISTEYLKTTSDKVPPAVNDPGWSETRPATVEPYFALWQKYVTRTGVNVQKVEVLCIQPIIEKITFDYEVVRNKYRTVNGDSYTDVASNGDLRIYKSGKATAGNIVFGGTEYTLPTTKVHLIQKTLGDEIAPPVYPAIVYLVARLVNGATTIYNVWYEKTTKEWYSVTAAAAVTDPDDWEWTDNDIIIADYYYELTGTSSGIPAHRIISLNVNYGLTQSDIWDQTRKIIENIDRDQVQMGSNYSVEDFDCHDDTNDWQSMPTFCTEVAETDPDNHWHPDIADNTILRFLADISRVVSNVRWLYDKKVNKAGDTMSGNLTTSASDTTERRMNVKNSLAEVDLVANASGTHGLYSRAVISGQTSGWIIYKNSSGNIVVAGINMSSQEANKVLASPNGNTGAPTFRALVAADIPNLNTSKLTGGTLGVARGGTGAATTDHNKVFAGPSATDASAAAPSFRALVAADIPNLNTSKLTGGQLATARGGTGKTYGYTWQSLGSCTGTGNTEYDLANYSEVMVVAKFSSKIMTTVIPKGALTASDQELWVGGGKSGNDASAASGALRAVCKIKTTKLTGVASNNGATDTTANTTWYIYAR